MSMAKLGFLGLGLMGYPMARNLMRAGNDVALWSNTTDKARKLASDENGRFCGTPKDVATNADVIFLCVGDSEMAKTVTLGPAGLIEGVRPGSVVVDCSTIGVSESRSIGKALKAKNVDFLDAPVTGSTPGAESGNLTFMIGGDASVFERIRPLLEPMGKKLYFCGRAGMGLQAKLTQNLILSNILMAFNEGMVLAAKGGMDPKLMLEILDNSAAKSGLISYKAPFVFARNFTTNFSVKWMHKDIGLMLESGQELGVPLLLTGLTRQLFQTAISAGHGDEDICSTIKVLEDLAQTKVVPK
ncbi:MAG TPA: NAD(P)-dependent oxidoreductase [Candidatus Acidoferrales bacterium]|nr:NAD(P)-dependent oxidoreductase [Candidatus Acidoferrales bacterium]